MTPESFLFAVALLLAGFYSWGFRYLPRERWQFIASVPLHREQDGHWEAANLTFYGLLSAVAYACSIAVLFLLLGSVGTTAGQTAVLVLGVLALAVPASQVIVWFVERKRFGFTVAGAAFVGMFAAPLIVFAINEWSGPGAARLDMLPVLAAMAVAYCLGEGMGRLACISFGCCYGRPVEESPGWLRPLFRRFHFVFYGGTKKISYCEGWEGVPVIPVQALTALVLSAAALAGAWLFFAGSFGWAFAVTGGVSQIWRVFSEALRADDRGRDDITVYQIMALVGLFYCVGTALALGGGGGPAAHLASGLEVLAAPATIALIASIAIAIFLHTGWSMVTVSQTSFSVRRDRV